MTHKIVNKNTNKNIINIKIDTKKKKKRNYKKNHNRVRNNQNGIYDNIATGILINKPQEANLSSLVSRENDELVNKTITALKRNNEILLLKDKAEETQIIPTKKTNLRIKSGLLSNIKLSKKLPKKLPKRLDDGNFSYSDIYSKPEIYTKIPDKDRFEDLGVVNKGRGRPIKAKGIDETENMYIERLRKNEAKKISQIPKRVVNLGVITKNKESTPEKNNKVVDIIPPINVDTIPIGVTTRSQKELAERYNIIKSKIYL